MSEAPPLIRKPSSSGRDQPPTAPKSSQATQRRDRSPRPAPTSPAPTSSQRRAAARPTSAPSATGGERDASASAPYCRHRDLQPLLREQRDAVDATAPDESGQQLGEQQVDREQLDQERRCCERPRRRRCPGQATSAVARQAHQADDDAEHARQHDAGERDAQRVAHADREGAQVAVARAVLEQQLADVEAGRVAQEAEARLDLARLEVGGDVLREAGERGRRATSASAPCSSHSRRRRARCRARQAASPVARRQAAPCRAAAASFSGSAARTSGRPWSTGC